MYSIEYLSPTGKSLGLLVLKADIWNCPALNSGRVFSQLPLGFLRPVITQNSQNLHRVYLLSLYTMFSFWGMADWTDCLYWGYACYITVDGSATQLEHYNPWGSIYQLLTGFWLPGIYWYFYLFSSTVSQMQEIDLMGMWNASFV